MISKISTKLPRRHLIFLKLPLQVFILCMMHEAGGVPAIINQLIKKGAIKGDRITVTGKTLKENVAGAEIKMKKLSIQSNIPISPVGGLSILYGKYRSRWAVIKVGGVDPSYKLSAVAICCDSQDQALELILTMEQLRRAMSLLFVTKVPRVDLVCQKCWHQLLRLSDVVLVRMWL